MGESVVAGINIETAQLCAGPFSLCAGDLQRRETWSYAASLYIGGNAALVGGKDMEAVEPLDKGTMLEAIKIAESLDG